MSDLATIVQIAAIARLRADATLQGLMTSGTSPEWNIFDQGGGGVTIPAFPYVYLHPFHMQLGTAQTLGQDANDIYLLVDSYTRSQGFDQARQIAARVYALLHGPIAGQLTLSKGSHVLALFDNRQELEEVQDGLVQRIADRYKLYVTG